MQIIAAMIILIFCILIWVMRYIDFYGAFLSAILLLCSALFSKDGFTNSMLILVVYLVVVAISQVKRKKRKEIYKKVLQEDKKKSVLNVVGKLLLPVIVSLFDSPAALLTVLSYGIADSAASQIGVFSRSNPRLITTLKEVPPGTNGGISLLGTLLGVILGAAIGIFYSLFTGYSMLSGIIWGLLGGLVGNMIDSFYGATIEGRLNLSDWGVNLLSGLTVLALGLILHLFI